MLLAVIGPITTATRLLKKAEQTTGISARIVHTPEALGNGGCSYSLKTASENLPIVMNIANAVKIKVKGYYLIDTNSNTESYHAIS